MQQELRTAAAEFTNATTPTFQRFDRRVAPRYLPRAPRCIAALYLPEARPGSPGAGVAAAWN